MQIIDIVPDLAPTILAARLAQDSRNTLARFLPNTPVPGVSYRLGRRRRYDQTVPVRAIDAPATPIRRPGMIEVRGELPAITPIVNLSEQDLTNEMILARQLAGLDVDYQDAVDASAAIAALTVDNTLELMRGQVLSRGGISLVTDDGTTHEVDFGMPSGQIMTVPAAWNAGGAGQEFKHVRDAHAVFKTAFGDVAGLILTTDAVYSQLLNALQAMYPQQPIGDAQLAAYLANNRLPRIETYDRRLKNEDGSSTRVYPEGTMTFLPGPTDSIGRTELGITQEAVQQVQRRILTAAQAPGLTIVTLGQDNPIQRAVKAAAIGMPVLQDTDAIVVLNGIFG
jgi:hypothetical protein